MQSSIEKNLNENSRENDEMINSGLKKRLLFDGENYYLVRSLNRNDIENFDRSNGIVPKIDSDSAYTVNAFNQKWIYGWIKKGWKTAGGDPVKNKELWQELYSLTQKHNVEFIKVKGHADNEYNNRCDELARNAIKSL